MPNRRARPRAGFPTVGPCRACGMPLDDFSPSSVACVGLGPELICAICHAWALKVTRWFLSKTRRFPACDTPARGIARVEPSANLHRMVM